MVEEKLKREKDAMTMCLIPICPQTKFLGVYGPCMIRPIDDVSLNEVSRPQNMIAGQEFRCAPHLVAPWLYDESSAPWCDATFGAGCAVPSLRNFSIVD